MKSIPSGLDAAGVPLIEVTHGDGLGTEALDAPKQNVRAWIHEMPKENWGIAGVSAKDLGRRDHC